MAIMGELEQKKAGPKKVYALENVGDDICQYCGRNMTEEGCNCDRDTPVTVSVNREINEKISEAKFLLRR